MVIEWLKFRVEPQAREKFIETDLQIWTPVLAQSSGFLGKEVWLNPKADNEVTFVIKWQTLDHWKSVPADLLAATEEKFKAEMGSDRYEIIEGGEYHIRKFSPPEN